MVFGFISWWQTKMWRKRGGNACWRYTVHCCCLNKENLENFYPDAVALGWKNPSKSFFLNQNKEKLISLGCQTRDGLHRRRRPYLNLPSYSCSILWVPYVKFLHCSKFYKNSRRQRTHCFVVYYLFVDNVLVKVFANAIQWMKNPYRLFSVPLINYHNHK